MTTYRVWGGWGALLLLASGAAVGQPADAERKKAAEAASASLLRQKWETFFLRKSVRPTPAPEAVPLPAPLTLRAPERRDLALESVAGFVEPDVIASAGGVLTATLTVDYANNTIGGDPVRLRNYNGKLVGPTLRAKAGDSLKVTLVNKLPANPSGPQHNTHHEWNTTNLHTHGLHVSPAGNSDNVFLDVLPGTTQDYKIDIPADHPAGAFWYHAHRHGSVAGQVSSGMSGAIVVAGPIDAVPAVAAARERVWVLQQIPYFKDESMPQGEIELTEAGNLFGPGDWAASGRFTTVNGVVLPVVTVRPGEVERWRIVDSAFRERIDLKLEKASGGGPATIDFHEIAADGIPLGKKVAKPKLELWPGYRSEVLVKAPDVAGEYLLVDDQVPVGAGINGNGKSRRFVARLVVAGDANPMQLPADADLAPFRPASIPAAAVTGAQTATYGINSTAMGLRFQIDGREFGDPFVRNLTVGKTEEWTLKSVNGVGPVTHPFHIHVNPFEVVSVTVDATSAAAPDEPVGVWRDTLALKPGRTYKVRTSYKTFTGEFVQHCHILDHEDLGMMEKVRILPVGVAPPAPAKGAAAPAGPHPLAGFRGQPVVVVMTEGLGCPACVRQLKELAAALPGAEVVGVIPDRDAAAEKAGLGTVKVVADPGHVLYREYGAFLGGPQHGVAVLDARGRVVFRTSGAAPFTDAAAIRTALADARAGRTPPAP